MKYYDPAVMGDLRARVDAVVLSWEHVASRLMFGCPCYKAAGSLFAFLVTDGLVLTRLPLGFEMPGDLPSVPFQTGERSMKGWRQLSFKSESDLRRLLPLLEVAYSNALQNPTPKSR